MSETKQMEALVWLGPREMEMQRAAIPQLRPGEVLIAVRAAGICGSELSGYLGQNSLRVPPLVMGHEAAGEVIQSTGERLPMAAPPAPEYASRSIHSSSVANVIVAAWVLRISAANASLSVRIDLAHSHNLLPSLLYNVILYQTIFQTPSHH